MSLTSHETRKTRLGLHFSFSELCTHYRSDLQNKDSIMRFQELLLVFMTLLVTVAGNSKNPSHSARSRGMEETDHDLHTASLYFSALGHHHGYPYGWNLPIQGLVHEHEILPGTSVDAGMSRDASHAPLTCALSAPSQSVPVPCQKVAL